MITAPRFAKMAAATITIGLMSVLAACGSGDPTAAPSASTSGSAGGAKVIVGSFAFPESEILGGALLVTALALTVDGLFALLQRATATKGLTDRQVSEPRKVTRPPRSSTMENA